MRVLIIEDELLLAQNLKKLLEGESFAVDVCHDGEDGLEVAQTNEYDLLLLDLNLPKLDGIQICNTLRKEGFNFPILMLTARDSIKDKITGLNSGADDYLVKPFEFDELLARINALLRRKIGNNSNSKIKIDTLEMDLTAKIVKRSGIDIKLSSKEYALLEYLILHQGKILSKSQIIEHVWDDSADPFSNVVDVYIGYIRTKIDKNFKKEKPLINTIKGMGYTIK